MASDDGGPSNGPDWHGFSDAVHDFEEGMKTWKWREKAAFEERTSGKNSSESALASCDFEAEDCLKAHFPDDRGDQDAPLQSLHRVARSQREELQEVLTLVREHAQQFEGHSALQLPEPGTEGRKTGADVVALLAELLDVATRSLNKVRKEADARRKPRGPKDEEMDMDRRDGRDQRNGREPRDHRDGREARGGRDGGGRDDPRVRDRDRGDAPRAKDDYRRDDRKREVDDEDRRGRRDGREGENGDRRGDDRRAPPRREDPRGPPRSRSREARRPQGKGRSRGEKGGDRVGERGAGRGDRGGEGGGSRRPPPRADSRPRGRDAGLRLMEKH
mmetsp:Transcript_28497/g.51529  ORF Transcript_28497/g.51529 Transcript_28497/m.51529 type:complete len:332 (-) Transcript_28497:108-1103(-)